MRNELPDRSKALWVPIPTPTERAAELTRYEQLTNHDIRLAFVLVVGGCFFWLTTGLVLMAWGLHMSDRGNGELAFLAGLLVGYAGVSVTLAVYYRKGERSGWW